MFERQPTMTALGRMPVRASLGSLCTALLAVGSSTVSVSCLDRGPSSPSGTPDALSIVTGGLQAAAPREAAPIPLVVAVRNFEGTGVRNVPVSWSVTVGDGSVATASSRTGSGGTASAVFNMGSRLGSHRVTATVAGLPPATFVLTGIHAVADPTSDTFATDESAGLTIPDLTFLGAGVDGDSLVLHLRFTEELAPLTIFQEPLPNELLGFIDIDVDQNPLTGIPAVQDELDLPGAGSAEMGVDAFVILDPTNSLFPLSLPLGRAGGSFPVFRVDSVAVEGADTIIVGPKPILVQPVFNERTLTLAVPLSFLNDDGGTVNVSVVVGSGAFEFTDFAPNAGHLAAAAPSGAVVMNPTGRISSPPPDPAVTTPTAQTTSPAHLWRLRRALRLTTHRTKP